MAHLRRNLATPPPMSPASTNAHNFYNTFAPRRVGNASPPPSMYPAGSSGTPVPQAQQGMPPPRPSSAVPAAAVSSSFYQQGGSNYVNAQYYQSERQSTLGMYSMGPQTPGMQSPGLQPGGYGSLNAVPPPPPRQKTPPPPLQAAPPPRNPAYRPIQSATFAPNHANYGGRRSPSSLDPNYHAGLSIRRPSSATGSNYMTGTFDEPPSSRGPSDLPLRNGPIMGIKAAARQRDQLLEEPDEDSTGIPKPDSYWGDLFDKTQSPPTATDTLSQFLRGIADYIITEFEPKNSIVITPPKMMAFYTKFRIPAGEALSWDVFFLGRPVKSLSEVYQALNCHHHLVPPKDSSSAPPTVPGLTPQGFERWMTIQILSDPDREAGRLITVLKQCPIQNPYEKDPLMKRFPKTLARDSFPKYVDGDTRRLWELFVPDPEEEKPANKSAGAASKGKETAGPSSAAPAKPKESEQRDREIQREKERDQRVLEVLQERDSSNRSLTPRGGGGGYAPPPILEEDEEPIPEQLRNDRAYETKPPPPLPMDNGIERQRSPYSRQQKTPPVITRQEPPQQQYDDVDYDQLHHAFGTVNINHPLSPRLQNGPSIPPKSRPLSPPLSGEKDKRISDFDREEEDLYKVMAAKRAEIAAIETRIQKQSQSAQSPQPPRTHDMMSPQTLHSLEEGYDSDEEAEIRRRAEENWDKEAREREKWVEARRRRFDQDGLGVEFDVATPISQYSWRDSYSSPALAGSKKNSPQLYKNPGRTARLSGGGEWEEFRVDEGPAPRRASVTQGHDRSYSNGSAGWGRDPYGN